MENSDLLGLKIFDKSKEQKQQRSKLLSPFFVLNADARLDPWKVGANYSVLMEAPRTLPNPVKRARVVESGNDQVVADVQDGRYIDPNPPKRMRPSTAAPSGQVGKKDVRRLNMNPMSQFIFREANRPLGNAPDQFIPRTNLVTPTMGKSYGAVLVDGTNPTFSHQAAAFLMQPRKVNYADPYDMRQEMTLLQNAAIMKGMAAAQAAASAGQAPQLTPAMRIDVAKNTEAQGGQIAQGPGIGTQDLTGNATNDLAGAAVSLAVANASAAQMAVKAFEGAVKDMGTLEGASNTHTVDLTTEAQNHGARQGLVQPPALAPNPDNNAGRVAADALRPVVQQGKAEYSAAAAGSNTTYVSTSDVSSVIMGDGLTRTNDRSRTQNASAAGSPTGAVNNSQSAQILSERNEVGYGGALPSTAVAAGSPARRLLLGRTGIASPPPSSPETEAQESREPPPKKPATEILAKAGAQSIAQTKPVRKAATASGYGQKRPATGPM